MEILSAREFPQTFDVAAYFHQHQQQQQQQLDSSYSLDDEFDSFHPHFPLENSSPSYALPPISPDAVPGFTARSVGTPILFAKRPRKQLKTESCSSPYTTEHKTMTCNAAMLASPSPSPSPDSNLISFGNPNSSPAISDPFYGTYDIQDCEEPKMKSASATSRTPVHAQEHVLAERKRREKISERFIALSAVVPSLKKMDKASILEGAIKCLKELQQRVKALEEEVAAKTVESVIMVKKSQLTTSSSSDQGSCNQIEQRLSLPEIGARVSGKCVLIKIHCKKRNGFISKMINEIEKLDLTVVNSCVLPFGRSILDVTIVAQMDVGFSMKTGDIVRNLRQALLDFM